MAKIYGISEASDERYACAAALTYWVFRCRPHGSQFNGTKTWIRLESGIANAANEAMQIEDYLQNLANAARSHLRPSQLAFILAGSSDVPIVARVNPRTGEISQYEQDQALGGWAWRDLVEDACAKQNCTEWDILDICRERSSIIQILVRLRFEEDRLIKKEIADDVVEIEAEEVKA